MISGVVNQLTKNFFARQSFRCRCHQLFRFSVSNCSQSQKRHVGVWCKNQLGHWVWNIKWKPLKKYMFLWLMAVSFALMGFCTVCDLPRPQRNYSHKLDRDPQNSATCEDLCSFWKVFIGVSLENKQPPWRLMAATVTAVTTVAKAVIGAVPYVHMCVSRCVSAHT